MKTLAILSLVLGFTFTSHAGVQVSNNAGDDWSATTNVDNLTTTNTRVEIPPMDEAEVNDIPFNTAAIAMVYRPCCVPMDQETYVNDIPFNTKYIALQEASSHIPLVEEAYVDDIPFNTAEVCASLKHGNATRCHDTQDGSTVEEMSIEINEMMTELIGVKGMQILEDPKDFIEEVGRMVQDEVQFVTGLFISLRSF